MALLNLTKVLRLKVGDIQDIEGTDVFNKFKILYLGIIRSEFLSLRLQNFNYLC